MIVTEYRIPLPLTIEEYQIGRLYTTIEMCKNETGGGEGVEILCNKPFVEFKSVSGTLQKGQYTYKIYHLSQKVPRFIRKLAPMGKIQIHEESWATSLYCKTEKRLNVDDGVLISMESFNYNDKGEQDNVLGLSKDLLKERNIIYLDIVNDPLSNMLPYDLTKYKSVRTKRGPFIGNWIETTEPIMTTYKLVTTEFKWFGIQTRVEKLMQSTEKKLFILFHRMLLGNMDEWYGLSIKDIRKLEKPSAIDLYKQRLEGPIRSMMLIE